MSLALLVFGCVGGPLGANSAKLFWEAFHETTSDSVRCDDDGFGRL